jgi:hypothetical protein
MTVEDFLLRPWWQPHLLHLLDLTAPRLLQMRWLSGSGTLLLPSAAEAMAPTLFQFNPRNTDDIFAEFFGGSSRATWAGWDAWHVGRWTMFSSSIFWVIYSALRSTAAARTGKAYTPAGRSRRRPPSSRTCRVLGVSHEQNICQLANLGYQRGTN